MTGLWSPRLMGALTLMFNVLALNLVLLAAYVFLAIIP